MNLFIYICKLLNLFKQNNNIFSQNLMILIKLNIYTIKNMWFFINTKIQNYTKKEKLRKLKNTLDTFQKRAKILIQDLAVSCTFDSIVHRWTFSAFSLNHRYYDGICFEELNSIMPHKSSFVTIRWFMKAQLSLTVKLIKNWLMQSPIHLSL